MASTKDMTLLPWEVCWLRQRQSDWEAKVNISVVRRPCERRDPYRVAPSAQAETANTSCNNGRRWLWVPAFAGTTAERAAYVDAVVTPPSTTIVWPVMKVEASEARYATAPAISSGSPMRRSGVPAVRRLRLSGSSHNALAKSVLTRPGATQLTRTPFGPHSPARLRHSAKSAAFEIP